MRPPMMKRSRAIQPMPTSTRFLVVAAVLALGTAQRNIAAALVVGSSFSDPKVVVMVVVVAIVSMIILMPLSKMLAKGETPAA